MSFLNWVLLGGAFAFTIPLVIHLLNRSRFKVVDWGAMQLLEAALQVNSKRIQWQAWLLLLMRCLIPILLAIGLARPVLTSWRTAGAGGNRSIVLLIDNSLSMQARDAQQTSLFERAVAQASKIITEQAPSTEISLWSIGGHPTDLLGGNSFDHRLAINQLKSLREGAGSIPVATALDTAIRQVSSMQNASREIILITDFQSHEWSSISSDAIKAIKQQLNASAIPIHLSFLTTAAPASPSNLSVSIAPIEEPILVVNQPIRITAQVRNHTTQSAEDVPVVLQVAGTDIATRRVSIPANGVTQINFDFQMQSEGTHGIAVRIEDEFGLLADNQAFQVVNVKNPIRVQLVDEQAKAAELKRASGYLSLALSPFSGDDSDKNTILVRMVRPSDLLRGEVEQNAVVVLVDAPRLNDATANEVVDFVRKGGGLLLFSGNSSDINWYNNRWGSKSNTPILPFDFENKPKASLQDARIATALDQHPVLRFLNDSSETEDLSTVELKRLQPLAKFDTEKQNAKANQQQVDNVHLPYVLLTSNETAPVAGGKKVGDGNVIQFAIAADDSDSNLPLRPAYLPLMQGIVHWLASGSGPLRNINCGQSFSITNAAAKSKDASAKVVQWKLTPPNGTSSSVALQPSQSGESGRSIDIQQTSFPGIYTLESEEEAPRRQHFAVNVAPEESETKYLNTDQIRTLAESLGATVSDSAETLVASQSLRAQGRELWRWFLLGLVAILFAEIWWQQRITRGVP